MRTLADVTFEQFLKIAKEEGVNNERNLKVIWEERPTQAPFNEEALRESFRTFRLMLNMPTLKGR